MEGEGIVVGGSDYTAGEGEQGRDAGHSPALEGLRAHQRAAGSACLQGPIFHWLGPRSFLCRVNGASRTQEHCWPLAMTTVSLLLGPTFSTGRAGLSPAPCQLLLPPGLSAAEVCRGGQQDSLREAGCKAPRIPALFPQS